MNLRLFEDDAGKLNRALLETGGGALIVSQFTLYGDARKGRPVAFGPLLTPTSLLSGAVMVPLQGSYPERAYKATEGHRQVGRVPLGQDGH